MAKSSTKLFRDYSKVKWIVLWPVNPARSGFLVSFDTVPQPEPQHLTECQALIKVTWLSSSKNAFLSSKAQSACATVSLLCLFLRFSLFSPGTEVFEAFKNLPSLRSMSSKTGWAQQPGNQLLGEDRAQLSAPGDLQEKTETCIPVHTSEATYISLYTAFIILKYKKSPNKPTQKIIRMKVHKPNSWWVKYPAQQVTPF